MRQLLIRVPDELHTRVTTQAKRVGISANALVNQLLDAATRVTDAESDDPTSRRQRLRDRARDMGVLVEIPSPPISPERRQAALESTRGIGPVIEELWADGR